MRANSERANGNRRGSAGGVGYAQRGGAVVECDQTADGSAAGRGHRRREGLGLAVDQRRGGGRERGRGGGRGDSDSDRDCGNLADPVVARVGDEQVAAGIHGDSSSRLAVGWGEAKFRGSGRTIVAAVARNVIPGRGGNEVRGRVDLADGVVAPAAPRVGDEQVAAAVHGDSPRISEFRGGGRTIVAAAAVAAISGHGGDVMRRGVDLADHAVPRIGDEQVAAGVHGDSRGIVEHCGGGRTAVRCDGICAAAGHGGDNRVEPLTSRILLL